MRLESQLSRMNCQTFSTGLSSGHFGGSRMMVILAGTRRRVDKCQPAWSTRRMAWSHQRAQLVSPASPAIPFLVSPEGHIVESEKNLEGKRTSEAAKSVEEG